METAIIESLVEIVSALMITLIGVLGAWLTTKLGKKQELASINAAQEELIKMAKITVGELQQTVVDGLKASREDKKLTKEEIAELGEMLVDKTIEKMSEPAIKLLSAAAVDITALIHGAGEEIISDRFYY